MNNASWTVRPIGVIHTPFLETKGTPIQPAFSDGALGHIEIFPAFVDGLHDLIEFKRIWLIFGLDRSGPPRMKVIPFMDTSERGLFATRSPCRPNALGLSCVRLLDVQENRLSIQDVDMLDNTPLFDIKPYVPRIDSFADSGAGWFDRAASGITHADERFLSPDRRPKEQGRE